MIKIHDNKVPFHAMEHIYNFVLNSNFHVSGWKDRDYINKHDILYNFMSIYKIIK